MVSAGLQGGDTEQDALGLRRAVEAHGRQARARPFLDGNHHAEPGALLLCRAGRLHASGQEVGGAVRLLDPGHGRGGIGDQRARASGRLQQPRL